jgi:TPR repeat protein
VNIEDVKKIIGEYNCKTNNEKSIDNTQNNEKTNNDKSIDDTQKMINNNKNTNENKSIDDTQSNEKTTNNNKSINDTQKGIINDEKTNERDKNNYIKFRLKTLIHDRKGNTSNSSTTRDNNISNTNDPTLNEELFLTFLKEIFHNAIKRKYPIAKYYLGICYTKGEDGDFKHAIDLWERVARKGCIQAQIQMGNVYLEGLYGVKRNLSKSLKYFLSATNNDNGSTQNNDRSNALYRLGMCYMEGVFDGIDVYEENINDDLKDSGDETLLSSKMTPITLPISIKTSDSLKSLKKSHSFHNHFSEAMVYFARAAALDHIETQILLCKWFRIGNKQLGIEKNEEKSSSLYNVLKKKINENYLRERVYE